MNVEEKFMLVLFEDDVGVTRSIDIVPAKWIVYDETIDHLVTPFISNCSTTNMRILKDLVKSNSEPLQTWSKHRISVRGSAKTYSEAERKIKDLETRTHVFTTDSEDQAAAREQNIMKKYKLKGNKYETQDVQKMLAASAFDVRTGKEDTGAVSNASKKGSVNTKKKVPRKKKVVSSKIKQARQKKIWQSQIVESNSEKSGSVQYDDSASELSGDDDIYKTIEHGREDAAELVGPGSSECDVRGKRKESSPASLNDFEKTLEGDNNNDGADPASIVSDPKLDFNNSCLMQEPAARKVATNMSGQRVDNNLRRTANPTAPTGILDILDSDDLRTVILKCYRRLSAQIGQCQSQLTDLSFRQTEIMSGLSTNTLKKVTSIDTTIEKYSLGELPFKTMSDFDVFDNKIKTNRSIRNDITNGMSALISSDSKYLIKSVRNILQRFMSRDLILMFTAVRQSGKKKVFKDETTFYTCMRDAILTECSKTPCDPPVKEKQIQEALGSVINNAKDWDGHRQSRAKK